MNEKSSVIDTLRAVRGEVDLITKLKEGSLEARRDRIAEALADPMWENGPAELVATYPHHVVASKEGVLMRLSVIEDDESLSFGKPEIFSIPTPIRDVGAEIMATAQSAAELVIKEDYESACPMIRGIVGALDVKGDLQRKLGMDVALRSLDRKTWWQDIVSEQFSGEVELPAPRQVEDDDLAALSGSVDDLLAFLKENIDGAVKSLKLLAKNESAGSVSIECARDIAEDLKSAIAVLSDVNREDSEEMTRVYEATGRALPRLLAGVKFLEHLAEPKADNPGEAGLGDDNVR